LSKREIERKKLDTKMLWGIGITSTAIAGVLWILNRHKNKQYSERAAEIDLRDDARIKILDERLIEIDLKIQFEQEEGVKAILRELKAQAVREKQRIIESWSLSLPTRLAIEACDEAAANCDHELDLRTDQQNFEQTDSG
jgi:cbb3-type cytochrome oxidase subunit 3